jgi:hypothetical protein
VHDLTPRGCADARLSVVSALSRAEPAISDGFAPFLPDAVAPNGEWRDATADELADLVGDPGIHDDDDIFVVATPGVVRGLADRLFCRGYSSALPMAVRNVAFLKALDQCIDDLIPFCGRPDGLVCQGAWVNPGGMRMVTHNMALARPRRIGFHVDNWDDLPLSERTRGRRRLCVNLGQRPRYLLFLRMPLSALVAARILPNKVPGEASPATLVRAYLGQNLQQLAVRLQIDPGEAYIVNADDVIHDGASDEPGVPDVALHFLGYFGPPDNALSDASEPVGSGPRAARNAE